MDVTCYTLIQLSVLPESTYNKDHTHKHLFSVLDSQRKQVLLRLPDVGIVVVRHILHREHLPILL